MSEPFLSVVEVAELLNIGQRTIRSEIRAGHLTAVRVGPQHWRIDPAELRRYLADNIVTATSDPVELPSPASNGEVPPQPEPGEPGEP